MKLDFVLETDEGKKTLTTPEEKAEAVIDFVKVALHLYNTDTTGALECLGAAKVVIDNMILNAQSEDAPSYIDF